MPTIIREADIIADRQVLVDFLFRHLTPHSDEKGYKWLYQNNPFGVARVWMAVDSDKDSIIGMSAAFPRLMYVGESVRRGWVLGDFCISSQYRSLGPAVQLQKATLEAIDTFCYDFPSNAMMSVYKRLKIVPAGNFVRFAKPIRVDRKVKQVIKFSVMAQGASKIGNFLLNLRNRLPRRRAECEISSPQCACGEDFSSLARKIGPGYGICIVRSADYMNWRYLSHPYCRHEILTARRIGNLLAYAVFSQSGDNATLVDLFGVDEKAVIMDLIFEVVAILRQRGVVTLNAQLHQANPWLGVFQRAGFHSRETAPFVIYHTESPAFFEPLGDKTWFLMGGDRDS